MPSKKADAQLLIQTHFEPWNSNIAKTTDFDVLMNIPGQQYTLGSKYGGRKENEEFIICSFPHVQPTHCKITVDKKGRYWIENLSDVGETYINAKPIKKESIQLKFGDTVSLGTKPPVLEAGAMEFCRIIDLAVFNFEKDEERRVKPKVVKTDHIIPFPDIAVQIGTNELIVSTILDNFPVEELCPLRLVSKTWNTAASRHLRKMTAVSIGEQPMTYFQNQTGIFRSLQKISGWSSVPKLLYFVLPKQKSFESQQGYQNYRSFGEQNLAISRAEDKYIDDVNHFFQVVEKTFETLELTFQSLQKNPKENLLFESVLKKVSPHLQHFNLSFICKDSSLLFQDDWTFRKLKSFMERSSYGNGYQNLAKNLVGKMDYTLEEFTSHEMEDSFFLLEIAERNFPNLSSISLQCVGLEGLKALVNFTQPLRKLHLVRLMENVGSEEFGKSMEKVFQNQKSNLQYLTISCPNGEIRIPSGFGDLKSLTFYYSEKTFFTFPQSPCPHVYYQSHFPVLQKLVLEFFPEDIANYKVSKRFSPVFESFFPRDGQQKVETLRYLVVTHPHDVKERNRRVRQKVDGIRKMFPNLIEEKIQVVNENSSLRTMPGLRRSKRLAEK